MVCPRENEVSVQANASFIGVKRNAPKLKLRFSAG
jgi:hypothetical protein